MGAAGALLCGARRRRQGAPGAGRGQRRHAGRGVTGQASRNRKGGWDRGEGTMSAAEIGRRRISSRKQRRFALIAVALAMLGLAVGLALYALSGSIVFFRTPTEIVDGVAAPGARRRLG